MPEADLKTQRDIQRLEIDFEKASPLAEWEYREVEFPAAGVLTTIRHKILGKGRIVFLAVHWKFPAVEQGGPALPPPAQLYTLLGDQVQFEGYIKVRSTVAAQATVLVGLRRDG